MSATDVHDTSRDASVGRVDMKLEVMIIPVSDVDRSKEFYERLGWRLDRDIAPIEGLRIVQFTPPIEARQRGPDPERISYRSFLYFTDPDGNTWLVQEVTTRLWSAPRPDERRMKANPGSPVVLAGA